jgi:uncharacterized membrane protein
MRSYVMEAVILDLTFELLVPIIILTFGIIFRKKGPKKMNGIFGYRTEMSLKNRATWDFANAFCARIWRIIGLLLLFPSVVAGSVSIRLGAGARVIIMLIIVTMQIIILILSVFVVEKVLKMNFDQDGNKRI